MATGITATNSDASFLVKGTDGQFKMWQAGTIKPLSSAKVGVSDPIPSPISTSVATIPASEHFLPIPVAGQPQDQADFHFHPEDQSDLQTEIDKINSYLTSVADQRKYSVEKIALKIAEKNVLKFSNEQIEKFARLLLSYFRQARSLVITKELLLQPEPGGFALTDAQAEKVMSIARSLKDKIEAADGVVVLGEQEKAVDTEELVGKEKKIPLDLPVASVAPAPTVTAEVKPEPKPEPKPVEPPVKPIPVPTPTTDWPKVNRPITVEKVRVSASVRGAGRSPQVMSRIDELSVMTLEQYRQLDTDPRVAAAKILQRINNLSAESLARKAQGIAAWQSGEVYQTYLSIGHHGLEHGRNIEQVIADRQQAGQPYLTLPEFEALSDLNKQLRF